MQTLSFIRSSETFSILAAGAVIIIQAAIFLMMTIDRRRRVAERDQLTGEIRLAAILENLPLPVRASRRDGTIECIDRAFRDSYGYALDDMPPLDDWRRAAYPDERQRQEAQLQRAAWRDGAG